MITKKYISKLNFIKLEKGISDQQIAYGTGIDIEDIDFFFNSNLEKSLNHFFKISNYLKVDIVIKCKDLDI